MRDVAGRGVTCLPSPGSPAPVTIAFLVFLEHLYIVIREGLDNIYGDCLHYDPLCPFSAPLPLTVRRPPDRNLSTFT